MPDTDAPIGRCIGCFHDFTTGPCGGCGAVAGPDDRPTLSTHRPVSVSNFDGMVFIRCSCASSGIRPIANVWLSDHWQGTEADGIAAIKAIYQAAPAVEEEA